MTKLGFIEGNENSFDIFWESLKSRSLDCISQSDFTNALVNLMCQFKNNINDYYTSEMYI